MEELLMYKMFVCDDEGELLWERRLYPEWLSDIQNEFMDRVGLSWDSEDDSTDLFTRMIEGFQVYGMMRGFKLANKLIAEVHGGTLEKVTDDRI